MTYRTFFPPYFKVLLALMALMLCIWVIDHIKINILIRDIEMFDP